MLEGGATIEFVDGHIIVTYLDVDEEQKVFLETQVNVQAGGIVTITLRDRERVSLRVDGARYTVDYAY